MMTDEQEIAIERLNRFKTIEISYSGTFAMTLIQLERLQEAIEVVLNMLEEKDKQIELMAKAFKQDDTRSVEEIIEYFKNLAKENEDDGL